MQKETASRVGRYLFFFGISLLLSVLCLSHQTHAEQITPLNHRVVDAEYSKQLEKIITVSEMPQNQLHIHDPETGQDIVVGLPKPPTCVSVAPDGLHAAVGHNGFISYIDLAGASLVQTYPVSADVLDIVLAGNGYVYAFPRVDQWETIRCIELQTGNETSSGGYSIYAGTRARLHPGGQAIYGADNGLSPSDIEKYSITGGTASVLYDSPYHGDFPMGGDLWISDDGLKIFTRSGRIFSASTEKSQDMVYHGSVPGTSSIEFLAQNTQADKVLIIPKDSYLVDYPDQVWIFDQDFLQPLAKVTLPKFSVGSSSFPGHGKYVFFSTSGDKYYVVVQADPKSGLLLDYGIAAYSTNASTVMYSIQTNAGPGGRVSPDGNISVNQYGSQVFAIVPDNGFEVVDVAVDGISLGKRSSLSFDSITANHTISAIFKERTAGEPRFRMLNHRVIDAEYNKSTNKIVSVSSVPMNQLHILDPVTKTEEVVDLPLVPSCVSVGPDGLHAAVGHDGWISYVDLTVPELVASYPVSTVVYDIVLAGNGYVYAFPAVDQSESIRCIELQTGKETSSAYGLIYAMTRARLHPGGEAIYGADNGLSPSDIEKYSITGGTASYQYDSPYHGDYPMCGDLWMSEDGWRIFTRCGNVFRSSTIRAEDMVYNGALAGLASIAGLDHSSTAGRIAVVPDDTTTVPGTTVILYDDNNLNLIRTTSLPRFSVDGKPFTCHGRFAFFNSAGDSYYALVRADSNSGLPIDWALVNYQTNPQSFIINAFAETGGTISPEGDNTVLPGSSITYTVTPDPGYALNALIVDGESVGNPPTYTFSDIESDHTISAVFTRPDYFGMQAGNRQQFVINYSNGASLRGTAQITGSGIDPGAPLVVRQSVAGTSSDTTYQVLPNGLFMMSQSSSGNTLRFSRGLPIIKTPLAANAKWTSNSLVSFNGVSGQATITANVSPKMLVSVPAGHFLAYPIAYTLTARGPGGTAQTSWTDYFAPYFGAVKTTYAGVQIQSVELKRFAMGGGIITTAPPVITGISPKPAACGSRITITGHQFGSSQGAGTVGIGTLNCQVLSWTDNSIVCIVPDTASSGKVTVTTGSWTSANSVALTVLPPPVVAGITPSSGKRGSIIQISGRKFGNVPGKIKFGSVTAKVTGWSPKSITCTVPKSLPPSTYQVTVKNAQGRVILPDAFTIVE